MGHAWRKQGSLVKTGNRRGSYRKKVFREVKVKMGDCVKDIRTIELEIRWREVAENSRDKW